MSAPDSSETTTESEIEVSAEATKQLAKKKGVRDLRKEDVQSDQYGSSTIYYVSSSVFNKRNRQNKNLYVNAIIPENMESGEINHRLNKNSMKKSGFKVTDIFDVSCEFSKEPRELFGFRKKPDLLERIDLAAEACGMSRAVFMRVALHDAIINDDIVPPTGAKKSRDSQSVAVLKSDLDRLDQAAKRAGTMKTKCFYHAMERAISKVEAELSLPLDHKGVGAEPR